MAWTASNNETHVARLQYLGELLATLRQDAQYAVEIHEDSDTMLVDTPQITIANMNQFKNKVLKPLLQFFDDATVAIAAEANTKVRTNALVNFVKDKQRV